MSIMAEIVARRRSRIENEGSALGGRVPAVRGLPVVPFGRDPFLICEIKRRSPSRGDISTALDAPEQARRYFERGARTVSVLTEEDHFAGSLADLMEVKRSNPELCVLRKDFLLSVEDVEVSYRAGADAVLLIAGILDADLLASMHERASALGLACLVEVHTFEEIKKVARIKPRFTGINARDLRTFAVDLALPLRLRAQIDWETNLVFESGMHSREQASFAAASGFNGILVGEAVVRRPELVDELISGLLDARGESAVESGALVSRVPGTDGATGTPALGEPPLGPGRRDFWKRLYWSQRPGRPLVKVCGLTNQDDVSLADDLGADLLGFVFAPSKRRADPGMVKSLAPTRASKVGVVVLEGEDKHLDREISELLTNGYLDAIQFHGDETPEECSRLAFPYYKALQLNNRGDCSRLAAYRCPRVLIDAKAQGLRGGTGIRLADELVAEAKNRGPVWLAGGIGSENVFEIIKRHSPELVDASSALEASPGRKDHAKLRRFFAEIGRATAGGAGEL